MPYSKQDFFVLNNGVRMPVLGLGTSDDTKADMANVIELALDLGYRHIDTATMYENEEDIGNGISRWLSKTKSKREDIFIVTKLPSVGMTKGGVTKYIKRSLQKLKLDYIDLYLIHFPVGIQGTENPEEYLPKVDGEFPCDYSTDHIALWKEMEEMVDIGLTRSIGVSNFSIRQLNRIHAIARIPPVTNQIEMHAFYQRRDQLAYCKKHGMIVTAFAPIGSPGRKSSPTGLGEPPKLLNDPVVKLVADNHDVTPAQILIKYMLDLGACTIPKSTDPDRMKTNFEISGFELTHAEKSALESLDKGKSGKLFDFKIFKNMQYHPECPDELLRGFE